MDRIRVLIADDHAIVRMGLASLLGTSKQIEVVGDAFDGEDAVRKTLKLNPDVVIMDLVMPRRNGIAAIEEIRRQCPDVNFLILTTFSSSGDISRALEAGALGAAMKTTPNDELLNAVLAVGRGERYLSAEISKLLAEDPPIPALSPRQAQIAESISRGLTNKELALQLGISLESVKSHVRIILEKLGAASRAEAVSIIQRHHLIRN